VVQARLIPAAREINDYMPLNVADLVVNALDEVGVKIASSRIAVLGYAYLENSDDTCNTPSFTLVNRLEELGARVRIHDPYVSQYTGDVAERVRGCDAVVLMVKHDVYRDIELSQLREWLSGSDAQRLGKQPVLVDGRRVFERDEVQAAGFVFRGVGIGH
jgi:UDP-N-acetyl-D-mannosaminuronic acid dehydrogenase